MASKVADWIPDSLDFTRVLSAKFDRNRNLVDKEIAYSRVETDLSELDEDRRNFYWTQFRTNPAKHHYGWRSSEEVDWSKIYFLTTDEDEEKELIKELKEDEVDYETTKIK